MYNVQKGIVHSLRKLKKYGGGAGGGAISEPKTLSMYLKKKNKKKVKKNVTEPGLEPTTSGLEKLAFLSTRLNTIIGITKYEGENYNIQTATIQNQS